MEEKKINYMSRCEAVMRLLQLARSGLSREEVEAIGIGVRAIVKRSLNSSKNLAKRREMKKADEKTGEG